MRRTVRARLLALAAVCALLLTAAAATAADGPRTQQQPRAQQQLQLQKAADPTKGAAAAATEQVSPNYLPEPMHSYYAQGYPLPQPPFSESDLSFGGGVIDTPTPPLTPPPVPGPGPGPGPSPPPRPPPSPPPSPPPPPSCVGCPPGSACSLCPVGWYSAGNATDTTASNTPCLRCPTGQTTPAPGATSQSQCTAAAFRGEGITKHAPPPASDHSRHHASRDKEFWERLATEPRPPRGDSSRHAQAAAEPAAGAAESPAADDSLTEALAVDSHGGQPWGSKKHWGGKPVPDAALPRQQLAPPPRAAQTCWCPPGRRCFSCAPGSYSPGNPADVGLQDTACIECVGSTTSGPGGTSVLDCNVCFPGRAGVRCPVCPQGTWSPGGDAATTLCTSCGPGLTTYAPGATAPDQCLPPACAKLGAETYTVQATFSGIQVITGNLQPTEVLPALCLAFGTTQPLPNGAAFFLLDPATVDRTFELSTCIPGQRVPLAIQAYPSTADCSQLAAPARCPDPSSATCPASTQIGDALTTNIPAGQKVVVLLACRDAAAGGGSCAVNTPYALQIKRV